MSANPLATWHQLIQDRNPKGLSAILSDQVVFHSPIVHTPQVGKSITTKYLMAALSIFVNDSFRYVRKVTSDHDAILEFQVEIDGVTVNGVDMITWNQEGQIIDFKVMLRPLQAVNLIHKKMELMLQAKQSAKDELSH
jgi:hypothetical protein